MIAILCGFLVGESIQSKKISELLTKLGYENTVIDFHKLSEGNVSVVESKHGLAAFFSGKKLVPKTVYIANNIRTDAILNMPSNIVYPNSYRYSVGQLFIDLRCVFAEAVWFPGEDESLLKGNSKPYVFSLARKSGLVVPEMTADAFFHDVSGMCKKPLGFPFRLSINKNTRKEVGVTGIVEFDESRMEFDGYPWQWQTKIATKSQIRCFFVDEKFWSVIWRKDGISDLRYANQVEGQSICWERYHLPADIADQTLLLMKELGLHMAAPEFLIDQYGNHVFIDLNPCGDWYGFFSEDVREEITRAITSTLVSAL